MQPAAVAVNGVLWVSQVLTPKIASAQSYSNLVLILTFSLFQKYFQRCLFIVGLLPQIKIHTTNYFPEKHENFWISILLIFCERAVCMWKLWMNSPHRQDAMLNALHSALILCMNRKQGKEGWDRGRDWCVHFRQQYAIC